MTPMIHLDKICKQYGQFIALKPLDLEIPRGQLFGFLGPNGAGKTTTIRILTGLIRPSSGEVTVGGVNLRRNPEQVKAKMGYVPDRPYLYDKLTPDEYFSFLAGLYQIPEEQARTRGEELLSLFEILKWRDQLIEGFSHGMKQKVAMSGALLHDPELLVIDEPTVGLDPQSVRHLKDLLRDLCRRGKTVFLSTHNLAIAETVCDRIGIINRGECVALGSMSDLRERSNDPTRNLEEIFLQLIREGDQPPQPDTPPAPIT